MAGFTTTKNDSRIDAIAADPRYQILPSGEIWTLISRSGKKSKSGTWRILKARPSSSGHLWVKYKYTWLAVHRIVFRKYTGPLRADLVVNHIDGNKENNTPANLELVTHSANMLHCFRVLKKTPLKPRSKITPQIAEQIRLDQSMGKTNRELREKYQLSKGSISYIVNGKTWKPADYSKTDVAESR